MFDNLKNLLKGDRDNDSLVELPPKNIKRRGTIEEGYDKLGRPYEKRNYEDGVSVKREILKDGSHKITLKKKNKWFVN